jgi:GT2 family glycosyltransferase
MTDEIDLEVVVVSYRCRELLRACLDSLRAHPFTQGSTIVHVVDNASGDGTVEMVRDTYPEVTLHALDRNAGFSAANNHALRATCAPYVLLLNPDTEMWDGTLDHMVSQMNARPDVGVAGCRLVRSDGAFDHAAKRSFPTPLAALGHFTGIGRRSRAGGPMSRYRAPGVGEHEVGEVDAVNGAFMLVRREALDAVGLLDEGYWMYGEDLDWCYRFHQVGWTVLYDGTVTALHVKGGTAGKHRGLRQNLAFHQAMARFYRKFQGGRRPLVDPVVYLGIAVKLAFSLLRGAIARRLTRGWSPLTAGHRVEK